MSTPAQCTKYLEGVFIYSFPRVIPFIALNDFGTRKCYSDIEPFSQYSPLPPPPMRLTPTCYIFSENFSGELIRANSVQNIPSSNMATRTPLLFTYVYLRKKVMRPQVSTRLAVAVTTTVRIAHRPRRNRFHGMPLARVSRPMPNSRCNPTFVVVACRALKTVLT